MNGANDITSLGELASHAAREYGDKVAVVFAEQRWTFAEIDLASNRVANFLRNQGVQAGARVSLYSPNCPEWIIAYYGILKAGAVVNPLNLMLTGEEAAFAIRDCGAVAVFAAAALVEKLLATLQADELSVLVSLSDSAIDGVVPFQTVLTHSALAPDVALADYNAVSTIGYTSGTTGFPKGAVLSHRAILMNVRMTSTLHVRTSADTVVSALPCSHVYGNVVMNSAFLCGMTLVLHSTFDVDTVLKSIEAHSATMFEGVPTMYMYILASESRQRYDLVSLRRCTVGGQTIAAAKVAEIEDCLGCPLLELWGMTELGGLGTTHSLYGPARHGSIGLPLPSLQARITSIEVSTQEVAVGEVGELQVRGPMTMSGYWGNPEETEKVFLPGGWLRTGDLACQNSEGFITIVDRLKDVIITGGFNIYPAEVERVIVEYPGVSMVAVVGVEDANKGELAKAFIVARQGCEIDVTQLEAYCRSRLAAYKVPRSYQFIEKLPTTSSGKVLRRALRTHA